MGGPQFTAAATPNLYSLIDAEASSSPIGANGVFFHPYLQGERCPYWDANLRASFTGVSISSTRGDFARALMEGVAFSLFPTSIQELFAASDAGLLMPPKSTWFEPKLLSGLWLRPIR